MRSRAGSGTVSLEFLLSGIVAVVVLVYLVYALLQPERF
jgi:K+-transporting ATPase KdpF subunit